MQGKSFLLLYSACVFLLLLKNGTSLDINIQPNPVNVPAANSSQVAITCSGHLPNVEFVLSISLERNLARDSDTRNLVTMRSPSGPQLDNTAPEDLLNRNPTLEGFFQGSGNSNYLTLTFNTTDMDCSDGGHYTCVMSYIPTSYDKTIFRKNETMDIRPAPSNVTLTLYKNGTEVENVSENTVANFNVGDVAEIHLGRHAANVSTYACLRTNARDTFDNLFPFSPNVISTSTSVLDDCNYILSTIFSVVITEDDAIRKNNYIVQCFVTSGTTTYSRKIYLGVVINYCISNPCQNGICDTHIEGFECTCNAGYTGLTCDTDIDECQSPTSCSDNSTCSNTIGSYTCTCSEGFTGDGNDICTDIDECQSPTSCADNSTCSNTIGSYTCTCSEGFTGDGNDLCTDINECASTTSCANNGDCTNTQGSYTCTCKTGFTGDGKTTCMDIDECQSATSCADNSTCSNTIGSYTCTCSEGFTGDGNDICTDIDECQSPTSCADNSACSNTIGSYTCTCSEGFTGDGNDICTDINECASTTSCANNGDCTNTQGSYTCTCKTGFTGDGKTTCMDIDECQSATSCADNSTCSNTIGSYTCTCSEGFTGNGNDICTDIDECQSPTSCADNSACSNTIGNYTCTCSEGFTGDGNDICTDINECASTTSCANNGDCTNTHGSYTCTCKTGFTGDNKKTTCMDIDECQSATSCADNSTCSNTIGSYTCTCSEGFTGDGNDICTDIDECQSPTPCADNSACSNTIGSYTCTCSEGFTGDGNDICTDINECASTTSCANNGDCTNTQGSYTCTCKTGFTGDGKTTCMDIDECQSATSCADNSTCSNTIGSYTCTCSEGFTGDGNDICTDIDECQSPTSCADNSACSNTIGSYTCTCSEGFTGDGNDICTDINECASTTSCANNGDCTNTHGSYTCMCKTGFTGDGKTTCMDIDECQSATSCADNSTCSNTIGSYTCTCSEGFTGDGNDICTDIDECQSPTSCADNSACSNTIGSYTCTCSEGFTGDGNDICTDINECASTTSCANNSDCTNTHGSYTCMCKTGFTGDGKTTCMDIDECQSATSCADNSTCSNTIGSYTCTCSEGFTGDGNDICTDIDECQSPTSCADNSACSNTIGSYTCTCSEGFTGDGNDICTDINECASTTSCANNGDCTNTQGSYTCTCKTGFTGDGKTTCMDIDECQSPTSCADNSTCSNTIGSYTCTCSEGFTGDGNDICTDINECVSTTSCANNGDCTNTQGSYTCTCKTGFTGDGKTTCMDINECLSPTSCAENADCTNTQGSYTCTCNAGFTGDGQNTCTDINECVSSTACANNADCSNTQGSYTCTCKTGFAGDGKTTCTDINECHSSISCANNGDCTNTQGSYTCTCKAGFTGDGKATCTDINECLSSTSCADNAACTNTQGSYTCMCNTGFTGDGQNTCTDINECVSSTSCATNADCANTQGSYTCTCKSGFAGNGKTTCTDINECLTSNSCANNAVCTNTVGSYTCTCNSGYKGDGKSTCTDINECSSIPCQNSGYCYNYGGGFRCYCTNGWTGTLCQTDVNECSIHSPCATNAACTNTRGSYTCTCNSGYTGDGKVKCTQTVLVSIQSGYDYRQSDDDIYPFYIYGGMEYYGKRYYYAYVSMNGYITLGQSYSKITPWTSSSSWRSLRYPIIAPLWADIDTRGDYGLTGMYVNRITSRTVLDNTIKPIIDDVSFRPRYCLMVTWKKAVPYPYSSNNRYENADFQVLLATNSSYTYVMFNYDQDQFTWRPSGGRLVVVGYSDSNFAGNIKFGSSNFVNVNRMNNFAINGRWRYSVSYPVNPIERAKALCRNWYYDNYIPWYLISYARSRSAACPCSYSQVIRDWRYSNIGYSNGIYQYRQRWTQLPYNHKQRCHYRVYTYTTGWWWSRRRITRGYLLHGNPDGGYTELYDSRLEISTAYSNCCLQRTGLCHLFYYRNPSRSCSGYRPPSWRPANGDPHITTFDGTRYTFNGRGEYTFVDIKGENITSAVQVRTDLVNDNDPDATIFVGIAGKDGTNGDIVEVLLDRKTNSSNIYINGNHNGSFASSSPDNLYIEADRVTVFNDSDKLVLALESGLSVQVSVHNLLDIVTSAPADGYFAGNTRGLLGNNDGDASNDFVLKNGTLLSVNSTEEQIFDFGMSWMIMENESLFNYTISANAFDFYNNLTIRPNNFIRDLLSDLTGYLETNCPGVDIDVDVIEETCGDNVACKVDAAATCNTAFGKASKDTEVQVEEENEVLENFPPNITAPDILYIGYMINKTVTLDMNKHVKDSNLDTINIETSIPEEQLSFEDNIFKWNVSEELRKENKTVYVRFTANDTMGASSEYWPDLYYCGCESESECDYSMVLEDNDNEDHFYSARCNCTEEREGRFCDSIKDRCDPNPCYENVTCNSTQSGNPCGACPFSMSGDGLSCQDTNECHMDPPLCNQTCENIIGSYMCSCLNGYTLNDDGHNCDDIDECERRETNTCAENERCTNSPGAFDCICAAGYVKSDSMCTEVISSFVGLLTFETPDNNSLTKQAVENLLLEEITPRESRVKAVEVTDMHEVETDRRKQKATFVLYSANDTLKTEDVDAAFTNYIESIMEPVVIDSDGTRFTSSVIKNDSKVFKDGEYSICDIIDKVTCDLESSTCTAEDGIQTCNCKEGFQPWSIQYVSCKDKDECIDDDVCGGNGTCENLIGSYTCVCDPGFKLGETGICTACEFPSFGENCTSTCLCEPSSLRCDNVRGCVCMEGWTGTNCETDVNECLTPNVCEDVNKVCTNNVGSYTCSCRPGYNLDNETCTDVDECLDPDLNQCSEPDSCVNLIGSYNCSCSPGYEMDNDNRTCRECDSNNFGENCASECNCDIGAVRCDPVTGCICDSGWSGDTCAADKDECAVFPCTEENEQCTNTPGSYSCNCLTGYSRENGICQDVDECIDNTLNNCSQICTNTNGSYLCSCYSGFQQNEETCADINECDGQNECSQVCTNTIGSYRCSCNVGFKLDVLDRRTCSPCLEGKYGINCSEDCSCHELNTLSCDTVNGTCSCTSGWVGETCDTNINECNNPGLYHCPGNSECVDEEGSYNCQCNVGYFKSSDGSCQACLEGKYGINCSEDCSCHELNTLSCDKVNGTCSCTSGWAGETCDTNINECDNPGLYQCPGNSECVDEEGSYNCQCNVGYSKSSDGSCQACLEGKYGINCSEDCSCHELNTLSCDKVNGTCSCTSGWAGETCDTNINECENPGLYQCPGNSECVDEEGSYNCQCNVGYFKSSDGSCQDVNECLDPDLNLCSEPDSCVNLIGSYNCSCSPGYKLENDKRTCKECDSNYFGENCASDCNCGVGAVRCDRVTGCVCDSGWEGDTCDADKDECAILPCTVENEHCTNTPGSYSCNCTTGYSRENGICKDMDECMDSTLNNCSQICTNTNGSYLCSCYSGFQQNEEKCIDINECDGQNECSQVCTNTIGSYRCSCNEGFKLDFLDRRTCIPKELCVTNPCGSNTLCTSINNTDTCFCNSGFEFETGSNTSCVDIKECSENPSPCSQKCTELEGGYECSCDTSGYKLDSDRITCVSCLEGKYGINCSEDCSCHELNTFSCDKTNGTCNCSSGWTGETCDTNINECDNPELYQCPNNSECDDTEGSYNCQCNVGYFKSIDGSCQDVNECFDPDLNQCSEPDSCVNLIGSYNCSCSPGYKLENDKRTCKECDSNYFGENCASECNCSVGAVRCDPVTGCVCDSGWSGDTCEADKDECAVFPCTGENEQCTNTPGSYSCNCKTGYTRENGICKDVDECLDNTLNNCSQICTNINGSYLCSCDSGYQQNEETCTDINECDGQNECSQVCTNTVGSYQCSCNEGFKLDVLDRRTCIPCLEGKYGINCSEDCSCHELNTFSCDKTNGTCNCSSGWAGETCDTNINECDNPELYQCPNNSECNDTEGSYNCQCNVGYFMSVDGSCQDVNECFDPDLNQCSEPDSCVNLIGSYNCSCSPGYKLENDKRTCKDVNECLDPDLNPCSEPDSCVNLIGSYNCSCSPGYKLEDDKRTCKECDSNYFGENCASDCNCGIGAVRCDRVTGCVCDSGWSGDTCDADKDECAVFPCTGENEQCTNTPGSYSCNCKMGYTRENGICKDVDECLDNTLNNCSQICTNINGSYLCSCDSGYQQNEETCTDINECDGQNQCSQVCTNTVGSYQCSCNEGFKLDVLDRRTCIHTSTDAPKTERPDNRVVSVELMLNMTVQGDLKVPQTFEIYRTEMQTQLLSRYQEELPGVEVTIIINEIRKGSLIIEYDVIVQEANIPNVAIANAELAAATTPFSVLGNVGYTSSLVVSGTSVPVGEEPSDDLLCQIYQASVTCRSYQVCVVVDNKPLCELRTVEDNLPSILGLGLGIPLFLLAVAVIALGIGLCHYKRKKKSLKGSSHRFRNTDDVGGSSLFAGRIAPKLHTFPASGTLRYQDMPPYPASDVSAISSEYDRHQHIRQLYQENGKGQGQRSTWDMFDNLPYGEQYHIRRPQVD